MKILITGISGTLGTAFTELLQADHQLLGIDRNETAVAQFKAKFPRVDVRVDDFSSVYLDCDLVIHLAAMKHIDLCESNAGACVYNNVVKTLDLFRQARQKKIDVLFMSTDKAVEPNSVYGYSKAIMEAVCKEFGFAFARSGNITDSSGSVMTIWDEAIANYEPIKITHKEMKRFFVSPQNLAKRIWDQYLKGIKEIIPEMDEDVFLFELANRKLAPLTIHNYPPGVQYIGLRPGEKLTEKLRWEEPCV